MSKFACRCAAALPCIVKPKPGAPREPAGAPAGPPSTYLTLPTDGTVECHHGGRKSEFRGWRRGPAPPRRVAAADRDLTTADLHAAADRRAVTRPPRRRPSPASDVPSHAAEVLEALDCGVILADEAGLIRYANGTAHELLATLDRSLTGRCVRDPDWAAALLVDERGELLAPGRSPLVEVLDGAESAAGILGVAPRGDAVPDWLQMSARAIDLGGHRQVACTLHLAPGNGTQRSLWARANRLRALLDSLPGAYFVLNEADEVIECSRGVLEYRQAEGWDSPLGRRLPALLSGQAAADAEEALAEARTLGRGGVRDGVAGWPTSRASWRPTAGSCRAVMCRYCCGT